MDISIIKKARRNIIIILFLSILCLILITFLPWIAVTENGSVKENLNFNYEMMKYSSNSQINDLLNILMDIYILFWTIVIISLISFIFIVIYTLKKRTLLFEILILTSSLVLFILCAFVFYFQIIFSRTIDDIDSISASMMYLPFAYAYIQFIFSIFLLIISGFYTFNIIKDSTKQFKSYKIQKKEKKKELKEKMTSDIPTESEIEESLKMPRKTDSLKDTSREEKLAEIDKLLANKDSDIIKQKADEDIPKKEIDEKEQAISSENEKIVTEEIETEDESKDEVEEENKEVEQIKHPFPEKKPKRVIEKSDRLKLSEHFEKVLSNAIEKKQSEIKPKQQTDKKIIKDEEETIKKETKPDLIKPELENDTNVELTDKILRVKCPECSHIFPYNKESDKKIICPKCGKEGKIEIKI
ncbi:hypothetical protein AYK21_02495 [Thermoplasmatales archaeon SG8-52-2]|nr:MAG: hypothetical protein AYK21_02495 [Thermoplasmatales archaeon SG8-52-2]